MKILPEFAGIEPSSPYAIRFSNPPPTLGLPQVAAGILNLVNTELCNFRYRGAIETIKTTPEVGSSCTDLSGIFNIIFNENNIINANSTLFIDSYKESISLIQKFRFQLLWKIGG